MIETNWDIPTCVVCGCTDDAACPGGCCWVEDPDGEMRELCSQCVGDRPWIPEHDEILRAGWADRPLLELALELQRKPGRLLTRGSELGLWNE